MNYYNEFDPFAAAWLRELISEKLIPRGLVDDRSITEVKAEDLEGFTQCHFFAGIGGWPLALQLAGVSHRTPLWTGSPPCQPFSVAGKQLGQLDERHLAPAFMRLVDQCRPPVLFGEQVAAAIGKHWLDDLFTELERQGYACGAAVLPAASVGAPHKRDRLFFGAHKPANPHSDMHSRTVERSHAEAERIQGINRTRFSGSGKPSGTGQSLSGSVADTNDKRQERERADHNAQRREEQNVRPSGLCDGAGHCRVAQPHSEQQRQIAESGERNEHAPSGRDEDSAAVTGLCGDNPTNPHHGFWSDADWLGCRDGKFRPVRSGSFPLANGVPARVGRLRGYGNAIVPQAAAEFIRAFMGAAGDAAKG